MRIGLLSAAHLHVDAYVANLRAAGAEVVGLTDTDAERGRRWCADHEVRWFQSANALFEAGVDGVIVCSETADHRRDVALAASAGVGVLCEKPLATSEADAAAIVATCAAAGLPLMTAFPMRFSPPMRDARELVASGRVGEVLAAAGTNQGELPMRHRAWFVEPSRSGGGALMDHVVHLADVLRWYLDAEVTEVYAATNRLLHGQTVSVETGGLVMLTLDSGVFASIDCSWSKPDDYPTWGGLTIDLVGTTGIVGVDAFSQRLTVHGGPEGPLAWPGWGSDANQGLIDHFLAVLRGEADPVPSGEDGLAATRVALAAARSAASGTPVPVTAA